MRKAQLTLKVSMETKDAAQAINAATLYVSQHRNGLAKLCPPSIKRALGTARDILVRQLTALKDILNSTVKENEEELQETAISICEQYFAYTEIVARSAWDSEFKKFPPQSLRHHPLYAAATKGSTEIEAAILALGDKTAPDSARIEAFIVRFAVARTLFMDAITSMGGNKNATRREKIVRSIVFGPEFKQAGVSILSYFSEVISRKYPGLDVGIRIEQEGSKVTLIIETPSGEIEKIEQELGTYGLVVTGQLPVENYTKNPIEAIMLTQKLEMAQMEIRHTKELLYTERTGFEGRVKSLESEIGFMRRIFDKAQYQNDETTSALRQIATGATAGANDTISEIIEILKKGESINQEALNTCVASLNKQSPGMISQINELFVKGAIQGAAGNYLYAALTAIQRLA